jgi:DUF4097 and DUF4098 domain-containing protein YvlB
VGTTTTSGLIAVSTAKSVKSGDVTRGGSIYLSSDVGSTISSGLIAVSTAKSVKSGDKWVLLLFLLQTLQRVVM